MSGFEIVHDPPLTLNSVLGRVFSTLKGRPGLFGALGSLQFLSSLVFVALLKPLADMPIAKVAAPGLILFLIYFFLVAWLNGALVFAGVKHIFDGEVSVGEALSESFAKIISLSGSALAFFSLLLPFIPAGALLASLFHPAPALALAVGGLLWLWTSLLVYIPACLVEDLGALKALSRSWDLTAGFRLKIFGLTLALGFILCCGAALPGLLFALLGAVAPEAKAATRAAALLTDCIAAVMMPAASAVHIAVLYIDLREIQECA